MFALIKLVHAPFEMCGSGRSIKYTSCNYILNVFVLLVRLWVEPVSFLSEAQVVDAEIQHTTQHFTSCAFSFSCNIIHCSSLQQSIMASFFPSSHSLGGKGFTNWLVWFWETHSSICSHADNYCFQISVWDWRFLTAKLGGTAWSVSGALSPLE